MTNKEKWIAFCQTHDREITLFDKPFWLDAVCNGRENWDVFLVEEKDEITAALPYFKKKKMGLHYISMPQLTPQNGIWVKPVDSEKTEKRIARENSLYKLLIDQIEASGVFYYHQCFSPEIRNWQPFYWAGYKQETQYTFWIDNRHTLEDAVRNFSKSTRANFRKASKAGTVDTFDDIEMFHRINSMSFARKNKKNPISLALAERVYAACKQNDAVLMLCAKDTDGNICDVAFFVYDAMNVYALMSGSVPEKRNLNFHTLLTYEGIKFALTTGRNFDFEGSMIKAIARNLLLFGAEMRPYYSIQKVLTKMPVFKQYLDYKLYS